MRLPDLLEVVRAAFATMRRNPVRSGLTILGLAIGVGAYIAMTSFGQGARRSVLAQFESLGTNLVKLGSFVTEPAGLAKPPRPLVLDDVLAIRREVPNARRIVPNVRRVAKVRARGESISTTVYGTTHDYFPLHLFEAMLGGLFDADDEARRSKVCVVGATVVDALLGDETAVGATISLGDSLSCTILGVLAPKGLSTSGKDLDNLVVIPLSTFEAYLGLPDGYAEIEVEAPSRELVATVEAESIRTIRNMHGLVDGDPSDFRSTTPTEAIRAADNVSLILARLLAAIAAISLVVGGIGIMNVQLVAVAERTREIGIRSAIGASPTQILAQFLAEAVVLSAVGAALGILVGVGAALAVGRAMSWAHSIDRGGILVASAFGIAAGVVFGYLPAKRAAELDPVEALRHE